MMKRFLLSSAFAILVIASAARAQEEDSVTRWLKDHVRGTFTYKNFGHFHKTEPEQRTVRQEGILRLQIEQDFLEDWRLFIGPQWKADTANYTAGPWMNFRDKTLRDPYFSIREAHLKYRGPDYDFSIGKQFFTWGTGDGYNPTDNLNPRNFLDVPDRQKMGTFSFAGVYYPPESSLTVVLIPYFTPSRLPLPHSRWSSDPDNPEAFGAATEEDATVQRRKLPGKRLDKVQVGIRYKTTYEGWDLSLSYFDGYDTLPVVKETEGEKRARPLFNRMHVIGMDFTTTTGKLEFHGEWAWKIYDNGRATDILPFIIGGNYFWDQQWIKDMGLEEIRLHLEYAGEITLRKRDDPQYKETTVFTRPFQNSILSRITFKVDENTQMHLSGNANFHGHNNSFFQPKIVHKYSDAIKIEGGWELFWGVNNSFWGKWKRNDRTFVYVTYTF